MSKSELLTALAATLPLSINPSPYRRLSSDDRGEVGASKAKKGKRKKQKQARKKNRK